MSEIEILPLFFFLIALIYSSVGFAGGSSYLLVLTWAGVAHTQSAPVALVCNLMVSSIGVYNFSRAGLIRWRLILPLVIFSVPMAFVGSKIPLSKEIFFLLLGSSLAVASLRLFLAGRDYETKKPKERRLWTLGGAYGAMVGFLSGTLGIGGGIFLSPFLIFTRWASVREASAAACFFIFFNSLSGFLAKMQTGFVMPESLPVLLLVSFFGGWLGSRVASTERLPQAGLQRVLAGVLLWISTHYISKVF